MYIELFIYTLSVYGLAWIMTQSHLTKSIRQLFPCENTERPKYWYPTKGDKTLMFIGYFLRCIVCASFWIGALLAHLCDNLDILAYLFESLGKITATIVISSYCLTTSWILGRMLGDAD